MQLRQKLCRSILNRFWVRTKHYSLRFFDPSHCITDKGLNILVDLLDKVGDQEQAREIKLEKFL